MDSSPHFDPIRPTLKNSPLVLIVIFDFHKISILSYRYYLCDSDQRMRLIQEFQRSTDLDIVTGLDNLKTNDRGYSLSRAFTRTKSALTTRRKSNDTVLYWTLDCKGIHPLAEGIYFYHNIGIIAVVKPCICLDAVLFFRYRNNYNSRAKNRLLYSIYTDKLSKSVKF